MVLSGCQRGTSCAPTAPCCRWHKDFFPRPPGLLASSCFKLWSRSSVRFPGRRDWHGALQVAVRSSSLDDQAVPSTARHNGHVRASHNAPRRIWGLVTRKRRNFESDTGGASSAAAEPQAYSQPASRALHLRAAPSSAAATRAAAPRPPRPGAASGRPAPVARGSSVETVRVPDGAHCSGPRVISEHGESSPPTSARRFPGVHFPSPRLPHLAHRHPACAFIPGCGPLHLCVRACLRTLAL